MLSTHLQRRDVRLLVDECEQPVVTVLAAAELHGPVHLSTAAAPSNQI